MKDELVGYSGSVFNTILAMTQTSQFLQILEYALAAVSFAITTAYTVWKWYKRATAPDSDGGKKITTDEIKNGVEEILPHDKDDAE